MKLWTCLATNSLPKLEASPRAVAKPRVAVNPVAAVMLKAAAMPTLIAAATSTPEAMPTPEAMLAPRVMLTQILTLRIRPRLTPAMSSLALVKMKSSDWHRLRPRALMPPSSSPHKYMCR